MLRLGDRLHAIADQIEKGETVADIGTDHGFLPLYLIEQKISPRAILADISMGSLQKAIDNARELGFNADALSFRQGSGLSILEPSEADAVVIAGMGGILMTEILGENRALSESFPKFILQPRNRQGKLRYWLQINGYEIRREVLAREGKFICEILAVFPYAGSKRSSGAASKEELPKDGHPCWEAPEMLFQNNDRGLVREFLENKLRVETEILGGIRSATRVDQAREAEAAERAAYFEGLLRRTKP